MLKKYLPFLRVNIMQMFVYRASVVSWFFVELFYFIMMIFLWQTIYADRSSINGFTIEQIVFYFLIIGMVSIFVQVEAMFTVSQELRQGLIAMYLIKPIKYKTRVFFEELGRRIGISSIMIPINIIVIIIVSIVFKLYFPLTFVQIVIFIAFIILDFLFMYEFSYLFGLFSIYTTNVFGLAILANIIVSIASGQLVPLDFYPEAIRNVIDLLPFQFISYYPPMVLMGKVSTASALLGMGLLVTWILVFKIFNHLLFKINEKKIVIYGG